MAKDAWLITLELVVSSNGKTIVTQDLRVKKRSHPETTNAKLAEFEQEYKERGLNIYEARYKILEEWW